MPIQGQPPVYTRGYSFTTHSVNQPSVPQPGDKLDQEFDDIATCIASTNSAIQHLTNPDGSLKNGIVNRAALQPGMFDDIVLDAAAALQPLADQAHAGAANAGFWANQAASSASTALASAAIAAGAINDTQQAQEIAALAATSAEDAAADAAASAAEAANSASTAEAHMVNAGSSSDLSAKWAEYIAGPVAPAPPGWPEAIDDGMWSAKWWAVRASEIVGDWGSLYLGAFPSAPLPILGTEHPPGTMYFDTTLQMMLVWNGTDWVPITTAVAGAEQTFVYLATNNQATFSGADMRGNTPVLSSPTPQASKVFLNGVQLIEDTGNGTGDYTVNVAASSFTVKVALGSGSVLQWDLLQHPSAVLAVTTAAYKLHDIDRDPATNTPGEFDGVTKTFPLRYTSPVDAGVKPANTTSAAQLQIALDGVPQEAGPDFTATAASLTFDLAPPAGTRFFGVWNAPGPQP